MRFKKMHLAIMVIALSLVLGSALNMLPQAKANPSGLLYYYNFEHGYNTNVASDNSYGTSPDPVTHINSQTWNNLDGWGLNELIEVSGTGVTPELSDASPARSGNRSIELYTKDGSPMSRIVTDQYGHPIETIDHSNDVSDRVQLSLIPMDKAGFEHGKEFDIGFSLLIPPVADGKPVGDRYYDPFAPTEIPGGSFQFIELFTMHTIPGNSAFTIDVGSAPGSVTRDDVQLKVMTYLLTCWREKDNYCPETQDDGNFSERMLRNKWYDILIQGVVGSYLSVKMKLSSENWNDDVNGHEVYHYTGNYGWVLHDLTTVSYLPKITLYRDKYVTSGNDRARRHAIWIDEVRVGTSQAAVLPGLNG